MVEEKIETAQGRFFIRPFAVEDREKVLRLWAIAFDKTMPLALWRWKYEANPFETSMIVCESEAGEIAAFLAGIHYPAMWKGRKVHFLHVVDNMSHPGYRGVLSGKKGLFARTAEHYFRSHTGPDKCVFVYGYPGKRHFRLGQHVLGYTALPRGMTYLWANIQNIKIIVGRSLKIIEKIGNASEDFDGLCRKAAHEYPFVVRRDTMFIRWRFLSHPLHKYRLFVCRGLLGKHIHAFAVAQQDEHRARIVDLFALGDERDAMFLVIRMASDLERSGVKNLECWLPEGHFLTNVLKTAGFMVASEPFGFVPACLDRSFHPHLDISWAMHHFYYTMADADLL